MPRRIITLCYRKIIDVQSTGTWEKFVFEDTYTEYKMQAQLYNSEKKYNTFSELILNVPDSQKLHFLVSAAVTNYVKQLKEKIPDITDNLGRQFLAFSNFKFEIINSDIRKKELHSVGINFFSTPFTWHDTIGDYMLLSDLHETINGEARTSTFRLGPFVSIYSLKEGL